METTLKQIKKETNEKRTHIEVPFKAMHDNRLNETARHTLGYIRLCQNKNRFAYPTIKTIASNINKSVSQVKKALALLVETGWIDRRYRKGPHGVSTASVPLTSDWKRDKGEDVGIVDDTKLSKNSIVDNTQLVSPMIPKRYRGRYTEKIIKEKENINNNISNFETTEKEQKEGETITYQIGQAPKETLPQDRDKASKGQFIGSNGVGHPFRGTYYQIQNDNRGTWSLKVKATQKLYSIQDVENVSGNDPEILFGLWNLEANGLTKTGDINRMRDRLFYAQAKYEWTGHTDLVSKATQYLNGLEDGTIDSLRPKPEPEEPKPHSALSET